MAQRLQKSPDLDEFGNPIPIQPTEVSVTLRGEPSKPPDLDIEGNPIEPEKGIIRKGWEAITKPIVDIPDVDPGFAEDYPTIAGIGQFGTDVLESLTSPLNVITGGLFGGARAALTGGLPRIAQAMQTGGRAISAPVAAEGAISLAHPESTGAERFAGALELGGGILGMRAKLPRVGKSIFEKQLPTGEEIPGTGMRTDIPITPKVETPIDKLIDALGTAKPLTKEQAEIYRVERAERFARGKEIPIESEESFFKSKGQLKGEYEKVSMEPVKLEQTDIDSLFKTIGDAQVLYTDKIHAGDALRKILEGKVPQDSEIKILEKIFGTDSISAMRARLPKIDTRRSLTAELVNLPRSVQAAYDFSFPFRQGLGLIHTKGWWTSWGSMLKSYGSEKAYRGVMDSILEKPNYKQITNASGQLQPSFAQRAGLALTDLTDITRREEAIMSTIAEKIPGVRASNRAYTAFANKLRSDNFDSLIADAERVAIAAKNPELNPRTNLKLARDIASFVNNASGRGNLGALERHAVMLNGAFFSPRLIASRLQMMNPRNYIFADPFVRKQYLKSMMALAGAWTSMAQLAKFGGAEVSSDSNSADFGKIKIGNTRLDPAGGFQQYLVLLSRLGSGEYTLSTTGKTREYGKGFGSQTKFDALSNFITNKLAPVPAYGIRALRSSEYRPFDVVDESIRMFAPIILQDLSELAQEDPNLIPLVLPASAVGMGTQTYGERGVGGKFIPGLPELNIR